jgi:Carbohydrate binding domain.
VETEALDTAYTGTISESTNSLLRVDVLAWSAGTFTLGRRVTHSGSLWECIAATTTATPGAGTVASDLTGTDGQVVVEIPAFSVRYGFLNGVHTREVKLGCNDALIAQGFQPHPAFIKTDGSYKDAFYFGAYHTYDDSGTGSSVSGQINTRSQTRATFRTEAEARGTGWHVLSYLELAAVQTLLVCEYQDYNSQRAIGNGSDAGTTYGVTTGQSDGDGNHSVNSTDNGSFGADYMSYRGIENLNGRAWQFVDGINITNGWRT